MQTRIKLAALRLFFGTAVFDLIMALDENSGEHQSLYNTPRGAMNFELNFLEIFVQKFQYSLRFPSGQKWWIAQLTNYAIPRA